MNKPVKIALGLATIWPLVYMLGFFALLFSLFLSLPADGTTQRGVPPAFFRLFVLHVVTILWQFALIIFYVVDVFDKQRVPKDQRLLWVVVLILCGAISMPIYWYLYIWREPVAAPAAFSEPNPG